MSKHEAPKEQRTDEELREFRRAETRRLVLESLAEDRLALERDAKYAFAPSAVFDRRTTENIWTGGVG